MSASAAEMLSLGFATAKVLFIDDVGKGFSEKIFGVLLLSFAAVCEVFG